MTDEKLKQYKEKIDDEIKQAQKQKALERAILKFIPKKQRGFMQIGASCIIPAELDKYYLPWVKAQIIGYEITNNYGLVVICKYHDKSCDKYSPFTVKVSYKNVYHSIMDFVENFYQGISAQIVNIQQCFARNEIFSSQHLKKTTEMTVKKLVNIKRKVDAKRRKKLPPNIQIPII